MDGARVAMWVRDVTHPSKQGMGMKRVRLHSSTPSCTLPNFPLSNPLMAHITDLWKPLLSTFVLLASSVPWASCVKQTCVCSDLTTCELEGDSKG